MAGSCFPFDALVNLQEGGYQTIQFADAQQNFQISSPDFHTNSTHGTKFVNWLHRDVNFTTLFLLIMTKSGEKIEISPDHLIHVANCRTGALESTVNAEKVKIGSDSLNVF